MSIELEYITAAGGRGDPARIRRVRGSFHVSSSSYTGSGVLRGTAVALIFAAIAPRGERSPFFSLVRAPRRRGSRVQENISSYRQVAIAESGRYSLGRSL